MTVLLVSLSFSNNLPWTKREAIIMILHCSDTSRDYRPKEDADKIVHAKKQYV
jgi:hypothetical protein